jgi:AcrR family transcriptional regulator
LRADAAGNRVRVLEVAYETFAAEGLAAPIDEIARYAGVGAGTVSVPGSCRGPDRNHRRPWSRAAGLRGARGSAVHLPAVIGARVGATDRGLGDALAGLVIDIKAAMPEVKERFRDMLGELLAAAQHAGTVRRDVGASDLDAIMVGCQAMQAADPDAAERLTEVVLGLRAG